MCAVFAFLSIFSAEMETEMGLLCFLSFIYFSTNWKAIEQTPDQCIVRLIIVWLAKTTNNTRFFLLFPLNRQSNTESERERERAISKSTTAKKI